MSNTWVSYCVVCEAPGHEYELSTSCTGDDLAIGLCNKHAKATFNLPLYNTVAEYVEALSRPAHVAA